MDDIKGTVVYTYDNNAKFTYDFTYNNNNLISIFLPESEADEANISLSAYLQEMKVPNFKMQFTKPMTLSFFVTPTNFNISETTQKIQNTEKKLVTLQNLSWHFASPKGGRRKTQRSKRTYRNTKKLHRRVRRRR